MKKVRAIVSLEEEDKAWLDRESARRGVSMAELIRIALRTLRRKPTLDKPSFEKQLMSTKGLWTKGDGLAYQQSIRDEW
ncbi:MAG: ribbon-helix-helix protein, CopG family [Myxococcales bacterium]|nr:MAG: ribbon-helix-helix protein, CopG family [Myxococcales bacterium]